MVGSVGIHVMFIWAHGCEIKLAVGAMLAIGDFPRDLLHHGYIYAFSLIF
jgi:hypothetical protein